MSQTSKPFFIVRLNWVDVLTLFGALIALGALLSIAQGHLELALGLQFMALLCDAFDGVLARRFGLARAFGRYLDGFADAIIYLIVPSSWLYASGFAAPWALPILALFVAAGLVRLSVFNEIGNIAVKDTSTEPQLGYLGLPSFWVAFVLAGYYPLLKWAGATTAQPVVGVVLLLHAVLMLHNGEYWKPRNKIVMLGVICAIAATYFWLAWRD